LWIDYYIKMNKNIEKDLLFGHTPRLQINQKTVLIRNKQGIC